MAGPKLNADQKVALRKELKEQVDAGTRQVDILASLGKKYGVSGETIRYYLKHSEAPTPTNGSRGPRHRARKQKKARRTPKTSLLQAIAGLTEKELRRALKAKALLVQYDRLHERERALAQEHRAMRSRTRKLKRQIRRLTS